MKIAAEAPIRWWFFKQNRRNGYAIRHIDGCPCGTGGSCDGCISSSEWLTGRWLAILHPLKFFVKHTILRRRWY